MSRKVKSHIPLKKSTQEVMNKKLLQWILKLGLTVLAFYLLSQKINWAEVQQTLKGVNYVYLFIALILYILSKLLSAVRLNVLQKQIPVELSEQKNSKLYFIGMFYNLFLPGGIGGDGYKAYYLKKKFEVKMKPILSALFLDRFFGLCALFLLVFSFAFFTDLFTTIPPYFKLITIILLILVLPVTYLIVRLLFSKFLPSFWKAVGLSLGVQGIQLLEALCILKALHISSSVVNYLVLFLASSVASVLPISVGGVGVRELVMVYGNELLNIDKNGAVAFSLLFFVLTAISSFIGAFLKMED